MEKSYRYISWFFVLILAIEIVGFFNSYFGRIPNFQGLVSIHHLHLLSLLLWFAMLFVQPVLIYRKKIQAHRMVGKSSYILVPLITLLALSVMKYSYHKAITGGIPATAALGFMWVSFSALVPYLVIYLLAIRYRKQPKQHMRYMISTAVALLGPAIGRINFGITDLNAAILFAFALSDAFLVVLIAFEYFNGKIYHPYIISLLICAVFHFAFPWISVTPAWQSIARAFVTYY